MAEDVFVFFMTTFLYGRINCYDEILQAMPFGYRRLAFKVDPCALWHMPHCSGTAGS
jgi:hypothetical protein